MIFQTRPLVVAAIAWLGFFGWASPAGGRGASLPPWIDLTQQNGFPPVTRQQAFSCSQQTALYYLFSSEWNLSSGTANLKPLQRFSPYFAYSLLSGEQSGRSHVVDGWITAQQCGVPLLADCPGFSRTLMHGYDRYLRAMRYRVEGWQILPVATAEDVVRVQRLLAGGHPVACDFQIKNAMLRPLPKSALSRVLVNRAHETFPALQWRKYVHRWGTSGPGHSMVYAGYDAEMEIDANGDGQISTDRDITGDGAVTLADCERGAFLVVNPWGGGWGDKGRSWVPVRLHATSSWPWSRSVATVTPARPFQPHLTLKLRLRATDRQNVIVTARNGRKSVQPWMFSHTPAQAGGGGTVWDSVTSLRTPGPHISPGTLAAPDGGPLETGHDLTTLGDGSVYSLEVRPAGRGPLSGELAAASFMEYDGFGRLIREIPVAGLPVKLAGAGGTWSTGAR